MGNLPYSGPSCVFKFGMPKRVTLYMIRARQTHTWLILLLVSIIIATGYTIAVYQPVGTGNQAEDLPRILRALDSTYLLNDHYVNASVQSFSIRFYYDLILVSVIKLTGLHRGMFFLTLLINIITVFLTTIFAYSFFENNLVTAVLAGLLVTERIFIVAGGYPVLTSRFLANHFNMAFIYLALYIVIFHKKIIIGAVILGASSLIQPLNAMIALSLLIPSAFVRDVCSSPGNWSYNLRSLNIWIRYAIATIFFGLLVATILIPYILQSGSELTSQEFVQIYGMFRIPHHAVPTYFLSFASIKQIGLFALLISSILLYLKLVRGQEYGRLFATFAIVFALLTICNYIFVEVIPTRVFTVLVPVFKSSVIVNWLGTIFIAGFITQKAINVKYSILIWALLYVYVGEFVGRDIFIILLAVQLIVQGFFYLELHSIIQKHWKNAFYIGTLGLIIIYQSTLNTNDSRSFSRFSHLSETIHQPIPFDNDLLTFVTTDTAEDTIFLVSPTMTNFRLATSRAVVVLQKTYPATDAGLREWYERMEDISTCENGKIQGFPNARTSSVGTFDSDDTCLSYIADKYNASYAVLEKDAETNMPIVFAGERYNVVELPR